MGTATLSIVNTDRRCSKCRVIKSISDFYTQGKGRAIASWCKKCRRDDEKRRRDDPEWITGQHHKKTVDPKFRARELLRIIKKRAKRDGCEFDLDTQWLYERLIAAHCELSGLPFDFSAHRGPYSPSVDRIIAGTGYTKRNCRVILFCINTALMDWGLEAFVPVAIALAERQA